MKTPKTRTEPNAPAGEDAAVELAALPSLDQQSVTLVPVSNVTASPFQPRKEFPEEEMADLRASIRANGIRIPLHGRVRPKGKPGEIELVAGERRWRCAQALALPAVPMIIQDLSDDDVIRIQRLENGARENLKALEAAEDYLLLESQGKTVDEICVLHGVKRSHVFTRKRVAKLPGEIKQLIRDGKLSITIADLIAKLPTKDLQQTVTKKFTAERKDWQGELTFREAAEIINDEYTVSLQSAPWELDDATLVKDAGPCSACPKRSGNIPGAEGSPNVCMDVKCFDLKRSSHSTKLLQEASAAGHRVIPSTDYNKRQWDYTTANEECHHDEKARSWAELARVAKIEPAVSVNLEGEAVKILTREDQDKICKALKLGEHSTEGKKFAAQADERQQQRDLDKKAMEQAKQEVVLVALKDLDGDGKKALPLAFWQKLALMMLRREVDMDCGVDEKWLTGRGMKPTGDDDKDAAQLEDYIKRQVTPHNLIGFILWMQMDTIYHSDPGVLAAWGVNWEDFKSGKAKVTKPAKTKPAAKPKAKAKPESKSKKKSKKGGAK